MKHAVLRFSVLLCSLTYAFWTFGAEFSAPFLWTPIQFDQATDLGHVAAPIPASNPVPAAPIPFEDAMVGAGLSSAVSGGDPHGNGSTRAIETSGDTESDVFRLGKQDGSDGNNRTEFVAEFSLAVKPGDTGVIYFQVVTDDGLKHLAYTAGVTIENNDPDTIFFDLGHITDGQWHTVLLDLEADLQTKHPDVVLKSVDSLFVYGSLKLDDVQLLRNK